MWGEVFKGRTMALAAELEAEKPGRGMGGFQRYFVFLSSLFASINLKVLLCKEAILDLR